jgi:hypothetical protein
MAYAGLWPGAPKPRATKTPDFVVSVDTLPFGVEVKRPESENSVIKVIDEAIKQFLQYGTHCHLLAVDLSDCLPTQAGSAPLKTAEAQNHAKFRRIAAIASDYITRRKRDPGFDDVAVLFVFADSFLWGSAGGKTTPMSSLMMHVECFAHAASGLIVNQAQKLRELLVRGLQAVGTSIRHFERL